MSEPERGLASRLIALAWAVLLVAVLLTLAVWLFQQIWVWLLILVAAAALIWLLVQIIRIRRDRWFR